MERIMKVPTHLKGFVAPIGIFRSVLPGEPDDNFVAYQIRCTCGSRLFSVSKNSRPLVVGECSACMQKIVLYDTKQYPSASSYANEGILEAVNGPGGESSFGVCVAFEYPEADEDDDYTENDISWCYIYGIPNNDPDKAFTIINDETM